MTKLNEHILFVMKWLDDPTQFTQKQIVKNRRAACAEACAPGYAVDFVNAAAYAANAAADDEVANVKKCVKRYFDYSGENKQNYLDKIKADKMEMTEQDIDWDYEKAKGCKWVICNVICGTSVFVEYYPYINSSRTGFCCSFSDKVIINIAEDEFSYWKVIKRPEKKDEPENIYTQAMFDAGELPKVGMKIYAEIQGDRSITDEVKIIGISECGNPVITFLHQAQCKCMYWHNGAYFKPIDTCTDKQKLADQIDKYVIDKNINAIDTDKFIDAIINGEFENLEYKGEK